MTDISIKKKNEVDLIVEADQHILYELQDYFCFDVEGASFSPAYRRKQWDGKIRIFSINTKTLPAGLVYRLCKWADKYNYSWEFENNNFYGLPYEVNDSIFYEGVEIFMNKISTIPPRDYQIQAVYQALKEYRKTIVSPTGSGKSLILYGIARYVKSIQNRTLIIVPTKGLVEQMYKDFGDYGWNSDENIDKIYEGYSVNTDKPVVVSTWQSIYGLDKKWFRQFHCVIGDECHQYKAKCLQGIMKKCLDTKMKIATTGTLDSKEMNKLILEGLFGPVYKTTTSSDLMEKGLLAKLKVRILQLKHSPQVFNTYNDEIVYLTECQKRNEFIVNLAKSLEGNVLVLFTRVDGHGIPLADMMNSTNKPVHLIHGKIDVDIREEIRGIVESGINQILLGSYGTMSTGINIKNIHHVIFASPSKSQIRVLQSIGRGLRQKMNNQCMLWDIADDTRKPHGQNNFTLNHLTERIKIYANEQFDYAISDYNLNNNDI